MKEIKFLLLMLSVAAFTSLWWIAMAINNRFIPLIVVLSAILLVITGIYIVDHWNSRDKGIKEIRFLLLLLLPVSLTSLWWAGILFLIPLLVIAMILSAVVLAAAGTYVSNHWNDDNYRRINDKLR